MARPFLLNALAASVAGSGVGSMIFASGFGLFNGDGYRILDVLRSLLFVTPFAMILSILPVTILVMVTGPTIAWLARRGDTISPTRFFAILTVAMMLACVLAMGPIGLAIAATMLCTYGFPTGGFYLHFSRRMSLDQPSPNV